MAKVLKVLKTLRNNWKKSLFAFGLMSYGVVYAKDRYMTNQMMRAYCEEAKQYGDIPIPVNEKPRHVTVILNPMAKDGKGKTLYEKYAAPLLHLAGIKVSIFQTEQQGQAKDLMEVMDNTDAVVIAGGNGTFHEVVTGLLRREDAEVARQRFPMGVLPIGKTNSIARNLFTYSNEPQLLAESAMAVIREIKKPLDVMKIEGTKGKPVYAVSNLEFGVFRDTDSGISKYWYFGPLKAKVAYLFRALKKRPSNEDLELSYIYPCSGCSQCYELPNITAVKRRWWEAFIPRTPHVASVSPSIDYKSIINEECGTWHMEKVPSPNIAIKTQNGEVKKGQEEEGHVLNVTVHSPNLTRRQFLTEGLNRMKGKVHQEESHTETMQVRELKLLLGENEGKDRWFSIDSDNYEVQQVHIRLLPQKIYIYS